MSDNSYRQQFAAERSHQNARIGYESAKSVGQAAILINGGAATAILAFMSGDNGRALLGFAPYCLMVYSLGVVLAAVMMYALFVSNHHWNIFWQSVHLNGSDDVDAKNVAQRWRTISHWSFVATLACFLLASFATGVGFIRAT